MTPDRKPTAAHWITVALIAVLMGYPLSIGPFEWLFKRGCIPDWAVAPAQIFWSPVVWIRDHGPQPIADVIEWYVLLWI